MKKLTYAILAFVLTVLNLTYILAEGSLPSIVVQLQEALNDLDSLQIDLKQESKEARTIAKRIRFLVGKINGVVLFAQPNNCKKIGLIYISQLEKTILRFDNKRCNNFSLRKYTVSRANACISGEVIDNFSPKLQESFQKVKSIFQIDENGDNIPDICETTN
ncbi:MAG: hypothetical protein HY094_09635 [Candidatus Melainabacteria bacterium]|nr:hypothetical protein [Candidatus Melainabacteria bacterium]